MKIVNIPGAPTRENSQWKNVDPASKILSPDDQSNNNQDWIDLELTNWEREQIPEVFTEITSDFAAHIHHLQTEWEIPAWLYENRVTDTTENNE